MLQPLFDPAEFFSDFGIYSISRYHFLNPYRFEVNGQDHSVRYEPAESNSGLFSGNSNWRRPIWFPVNYLLIESLRKFDQHYGVTLKIQVPRGSGQWLTIGEAADEIAQRLISIFTRDVQNDGRRPVFDREQIFQTDPYWRDPILFYEYFHGDNDAGISASHQTGWTALAANLIQSQFFRRNHD